MSGFGGMISVELGSRDKAAHLLEHVKVFALAESLGGVESLISQPAGMTHASVPPERRAALGLTDGLVRLSCGVEDTAGSAERSGAGVRRDRRRWEGDEETRHKAGGGRVVSLQASS